MADTEKQKIGKIGEDIACTFLMKHGFKILDRNYRKKWGEIDIVAQKEHILRFIEVKSVSRETFKEANNNDFRPEDNVHFWKLKRLSRVIQTYLLDKNVSHETEWQIDIITVVLNLKERKAKVKIIPNIII